MDFSKLSQTEKLAVYGSAAVIVGGLIGYSYGMTILALLAAIAMLAVIFLPQMSSGTSLPGSKGSLMLICGGVAGVVLLLAALLYLGTIFTATDFRDIFFLVAVVGGLVMAWAGWQQFQSEGGKFKVGTTTASGTAAASPTSSPAPAAPAEPAAAASDPAQSTIDSAATSANESTEERRDA